MPTKELRCNCSTLRSASRTLTAAYDEALRGSGLRVTQFSILARVAAFERLMMSELAERMAMDRTTLARNLAPLEKEQLVTVTVGGDRRKRFIELTAKGQRVLANAMPLWESVHERFERRFGKQRASELRDFLGSVVVTGRAIYEEIAGHPAH